MDAPAAKREMQRGQRTAPVYSGATQPTGAGGDSAAKAPKKSHGVRQHFHHTLMGDVSASGQGWKRTEKAAATMAGAQRRVGVKMFDKIMTGFEAI
jgi:hypothetical protein